MSAKAEPDWDLPRYWWAAVIVPIATFAAVNWMLTHWGPSSIQLARPWIADGHMEAAGRLRTLATFLLYCGFGLTGLAYSALIVWRLSSGAFWRILVGALLSLAAGVTLAVVLGLDQGDPYLERDFACASFDLLPMAKAETGQADKGQRVLPPPAAVAKGPPPPRAAGLLACRQGKPEIEGPLPVYRSGWKIFHVPGARYSADPYRVLRILYGLSGLLLFLAMPAVIWAAVACLARPDSGSAAKRYAAWAEQTGRLNRLLYVTAGFMIAGLLFTNARMMWPAYSLHPADLPAYSAHVSSLVLYLGVANSVLIASYYLPVAAFLSSSRPRAPQPSRGPEGATSEAEGPDPWAAFRATATILSPALVALIGEIAKFTG